MEQQVDLPFILMILLFLSVLGGSFTLWMQHIQRPRTTIIEPEGLPGWSIGWVNFGIFTCTLVVVSVFIQYAAFTLFIELPTDPNTPQELTPWLAVFSVLVFQFPLLLVFYALRLFYPSEFAGRLSEISISLTQTLKNTIPLFIMYLPVIWLAASVWGYALSKIEDTGLIGKATPQPLITLLECGGDPLALGLLALFAVVLVPVVEELIFRGCLYRFLKSQSSILPAQIISGAIFSLIHANLFSFLPLVIVGILLARVYEKSGSILTPICFHALFNGFNLIMIFLKTITEVDIQ